jgi:hypothetical protein
MSSDSHDDLSDWDDYQSLTRAECEAELEAIQQYWAQVATVSPLERTDMSTPIELNEDERGAALEALLSARNDDCSPVSTLARIFDAVNRVRTT